MSQSARIDVTICNIRGLHARAAARFCEAAGGFSSAISVSKDGLTVGGTSLMALLMLGAGKGSVVTISADGEDADAALAALKDLVETRFGEES